MKANYIQTLTTTCFNTPLGEVLAIGDDKALYLLEFVDYKNIDYFMLRLQKKTQAKFTNGKTPILTTIEKELALYFSGKLTQFKTPIQLIGSAFQETVWRALRKIPYGKTISYTELASLIGKPTACRAVANANGANPLVILIPCHRVISHDGGLGGYGGGLERKRYLLDLEKSL